MESDEKIKDIEAAEEDITKLENDIEEIKEFKESDEYKEYEISKNRMDRTIDPELKEKRRKDIEDKYNDTIYTSTTDIVGSKEKEIELLRKEIILQATECAKEMQEELLNLEEYFKKYDEAHERLKEEIEKKESELSSKREEMSEDEIAEAEILIDADKKRLEFSNANRQKYHEKATSLKEKMESFVKKYEVKLDKEDPEKEAKEETEKEAKGKKINKGNKNSSLEPRIITSTKSKEEMEAKKYTFVQQCTEKVTRASIKKPSLSNEELKKLLSILAEDNSIKRYGITHKGRFNAVSIMGLKIFGNESKSLVENLGAYTAEESRKAREIIYTKIEASEVHTLRTDKPWKNDEMTLGKIDEMANSSKVEDIVMKGEDKADWSVSKEIDSVVGVLSELESKGTISEKDKASLEELREYKTSIDNFKKYSANYVETLIESNPKKQKLLTAAKEKANKIKEAVKDKEKSLRDSWKDETYPPAEAETNSKEVEEESKGKESKETEISK